uniref:Uncharacterized protein n=1 Tax=Amphimedon queenslandica TaxID=400682 RepID=A0A1X7TDZ4_AMPQE
LYLMLYQMAGSFTCTVILALLKWNLNLHIKSPCNLYTGLTGHITQFEFKNSRTITGDLLLLDRLLIETDSPYMMPFSMRPGCSSAHCMV